MNQQLFARIAAVVFCLGLIAGGAFPADKLPASLAGTIPPQPQGQIAFIRDGAVWMMDATGAKQTKICDVQNADGRISWSPDGRHIAFTRSSKLQYQTPDNGGGMRKLYDIFVINLDTARTGHLFYNPPLTSTLGGRDPEWSADGSTILFTWDKNANLVDASGPNYQICTMNANGGNVQILRKDWQGATECFMSPTMSPNGDIAFVHLYPSETPNSAAQDMTDVQTRAALKPQGIAVLNRANFMTPFSTVKQQTKRMLSCTGPSWSPDGKWLAYIKNDVNSSGLYIATPDLAKSYLVYAPPATVGMRPVAPSWSPDGKWLAFGTGDGSIYICDLTGNNVRRLTGPGSDWAPSWSRAPRAASRSMSGGSGTTTAAKKTKAGQ